LAQVKLMLRQQERLDGVMLLVAWYVWRERVVWLQTCASWTWKFGCRPSVLLAVLQEWRCAVTLGRQEAIEAKLRTVHGSIEQCNKAEVEVVGKVKDQGVRQLQQLHNALHGKDLQSLRREVFETWLHWTLAQNHQHFCRQRRHRLCHSLARPHLLRCGRRAYGAWKQQVLESLELKGASRLFLKFKLLHQGSCDKDFLHVIFMRWMQLIRPRRRMGCSFSWQHAWQLLGAQQIFAADQQLWIIDVLNAWHAVVDLVKGTAAMETLKQRHCQAEVQRRKLQACRQMMDLTVNVELTSHLLTHCMVAWKEFWLRGFALARSRGEHSTEDEAALEELSLQSMLKFSTLDGELALVEENMQSLQLAQHTDNLAAGFRRLEDVWVRWPCRRQLLEDSVCQWRRWNAGISLHKNRRRAEVQQERIIDLENQAEPMEDLVRSSRQFLLSYLCNCCCRWRHTLLREVLRLWCISIRFMRDEAQDEVVELRAKAEVQTSIGKALGALTLMASQERAEHFLLEAWLRVAEQEKHQREVEVLNGDLHTAFLDLYNSTASCKKVSSTILEWMHQNNSGGAEHLRDLLRGWAMVASVAMQNKLTHFRKLQAESEISKLCVSTGEWIDQLQLRQVLKLWQQQALEEVLTRHHLEEERSVQLQKRLRGHYRIIEIIRSNCTASATAWALAHVCLGAWSVFAAMENAQKLTNKARQNSIGHRSHGLRLLSNAEDLAGHVLGFVCRKSFGAVELPPWTLVKRCFPLWRREAQVSSTRRRVLQQEAANLKVTEELRYRTEEYQLRCARWAVFQMICHRNMRYLEEAFFLWRDQKPKWRQRNSHRNSLELADTVFVKAANPVQVFFVAWRRSYTEEKVLKAEEHLRYLEGQLARLAGERSLSVRTLEERLALDDLEL